jgi:hypothetical protein
MNYEEMSDDKINELVTIAVIKQTFKDVKSVKRDGSQGYVWVEVHGFSSEPIYEYCTRAADWGKLMQDNKISIKTMPDYLDVTIRGWEATGSLGLVEQFYNSEKPGRAIAICYLKMKEANNG